ncbi:type II toxin-antitoxin system Phd/YefM family antitoxin [Levilactobacillus cerevisiae]|uniref:type II toxin-antitoxin system Phd/YefM family antitoxin n=1 Tax=Levilactobacillus cerevisiae TaxID=1704076 RepID=UPI000F76D416|nr:type II toxin-antitoxin system Phd/YefM family antitoxin [Levilactobacillus cerevisiae]
MKQYTPLAAQQDLDIILAAVHQLQETIVITPTDGDDEQAAVLIPKREWEAMAELAFLQAPQEASSPRLTPTQRRFNDAAIDKMEWG